MGILLSSKSETILWLNGSELALLIFGLILVAGLVGEFLLDHRPPKGLKPPSKRRKSLKRLCETLVILGVAGEILADGGIFGFESHLEEIADSEIRYLGKENSDLMIKLEAAERSEQTNSLAVAVLNEEASTNELETARVEQQMMETTNRVENIEPLNQPIISITIEVDLFTTMDAASPATGMKNLIRDGEYLTNGWVSIGFCRLDQVKPGLNMDEPFLMCSDLEHPGPNIWSLKFSKTGGIFLKMSPVRTIKTLNVYMLNAPFLTNGTDVSFGNMTVIANTMAWQATITPQIVKSKNDLMNFDKHPYTGVTIFGK